jgi:hypothetical protein
LYFDEFPFELSAVISKCDFVSPIVFSAKRKGEREGESINWFIFSKKKNVNFGKHQAVSFGKV